MKIKSRWALRYWLVRNSLWRRFQRRQQFTFCLTDGRQLVFFFFFACGIWGIWTVASLQFKQNPAKCPFLEQHFLLCHGMLFVSWFYVSSHLWSHLFVDILFWRFIGQCSLLRTAHTAGSKNTENFICGNEWDVDERPGAVHGVKGCAGEVKWRERRGEGGSRAFTPACTWPVTPAPVLIDPNPRGGEPFWSGLWSATRVATFFLREPGSLWKQWIPSVSCSVW